MRRLVCASVLTGLSFAAPLAAAPISFVTYSAAGPDSAAIAPTVAQFRNELGALNANVVGSFGSGRREINWDGVPAAFADPNPLPANFFNSNSPRGVVLSTPGTGFLVSANSGGATPVLFGFPNDFQVFSAQKLFTAVNSPITDVSLFIPGTSTAALTRGFGVVFTDVEVATSTSLEFFDSNNNSIFFANALVGGNQGLSFLGALTTDSVISRIRITSGANTIVSNGVLGNQVDDIVTMDDFIFAEPTAVPEPATLLLVGGGLLAVTATRRRRRR